MHFDHDAYLHLSARAIGRYVDQAYSISQPIPCRGYWARLWAAFYDLL